MRIHVLVITVELRSTMLLSKTTPNTRSKGGVKQVMMFLVRIREAWGSPWEHLRKTRCRIWILAGWYREGLKKRGFAFDQMLQKVGAIVMCHSINLTYQEGRPIKGQMYSWLDRTKWSILAKRGHVWSGVDGKVTLLLSVLRQNYKWSCFISFYLGLGVIQFEVLILWSLFFV